MSPAKRTGPKRNLRARFRIVGRLEGGRPEAGTVTIDRAIGLFSVRPLRRRRQYTMPLAVVAEIVVAKVIKAEVAARRRAQK